MSGKEYLSSRDALNSLCSNSDQVKSVRWNGYGLTSLGGALIFAGYALTKVAYNEFEVDPLMLGAVKDRLIHLGSFTPGLVAGVAGVPAAFSVAGQDNDAPVRFAGKGFARLRFPFNLLAKEVHPVEDTKDLEDYVGKRVFINGVGIYSAEVMGKVSDEVQDYLNRRADKFVPEIPNEVLIAGRIKGSPLLMRLTASAKARSGVKVGDFRKRFDAYVCGDVGNEGELHLMKIGSALTE